MAVPRHLGQQGAAGSLAAGKHAHDPARTPAGGGRAPPAGPGGIGVSAPCGQPEGRPLARTSPKVHSGLHWHRSGGHLLEADTEETAMMRAGPYLPVCSGC